MNASTFAACGKLIPEGYIKQAEGARNARSNLIRELIEKRKIPQHGWDETTVNMFLEEISLMDSNNFLGNCGVGEREGRIFSPIVRKRHFGLSHGIGRSGDITAIQPKAAGSSLLNSITNSLVLDSIRLAGVLDCNSCFVVPMATGMALVLCMQALRTKRPNAMYVLWTRIDQKSCFKSVNTAGLIAVVIENCLDDDQLSTDVDTIQKKVEELGADNILCVMSTTSCFAPRGIDKLDDISVICEKNGVPHLVNNAYGVQATKCMHVIQQAHKRGRLDIFVQSSDKNYMVPVGGAVIAGFDKSLIEHIGQTYPGRASSTPSLDLFITLVSMGAAKFKSLLIERKDMYKYLKSSVEKVIEKYGLRILHTPDNPISMGITLPSALSPHQLTEIGSMLFTRNVSGLRVVTSADEKTINDHIFHGFGSHHNKYPFPYCTVAASIGMEKLDVETFSSRLDKVLAKVTSVSCS